MALDHSGGMAQTPLRALIPGDCFQGFYLLESAQTGTTAAGKPYLSFRLADITGELAGKLWDYSGPVGPGDAGQVVRVSGRVETYQNAPQAILEQLRLAEAEDDVDLSVLVPTAPRDPARMLAYVESTLQKLDDADYRGVCLAMLERHREAFASIPGAKNMHHGFRHGLLMHTANMMRQAEMLARIYQDVVDRSLLIAGAFLHDIGKLKEYAVSPLGLVSDYAREGQLLGHLFLGAEEVGAVARSLDVPEEKVLLLQHLIASHHGKPEFGTIVLPKCPEAELLSEIDMIDSRMEMFRKTFEETPPGRFSSRKVYGLGNCSVYHPGQPEEPED